MIYIYDFALICLVAYLCINYSYLWLLLLLFFLTKKGDEKNDTE